MIYSYNDSDESRIYHLFIFPSYISVKKKKKIIKDSIQIYKEIYIISSNSPFYRLLSTLLPLILTLMSAHSYNIIKISNQQKIFCE